MSKAFRSLDPDDAEHNQRRRRFRQVSIRAVAPNAITLLALCAGMTAIRMAVEGRFDVAVGAVLLAGVLDALDGRIARMLKSASKFGAELDSLADFISFGVAPAVVLYLWSLNVLGSLGWIVALSLAVCAALRLARFNVALDDPDRPAWTANFFTGVPAPAGAGLALLPMYMAFVTGFEGASLAPLVLIYTPAIGFLMVSQIPTFSGKVIGQRIRRDAVLPVLLLFVLFISLLLSFPWKMLTALALVYLAVIPLGVMRYRQLERNYAEGSGKRAAKPGARQDQT